MCYSALPKPTYYMMRAVMFLPYSWHAPVATKPPKQMEAKRNSTLEVWKNKQIPHKMREGNVQRRADHHIYQAAFQSIFQDHFHINFPPLLKNPPFHKQSWPMTSPTLQLVFLEKKECRWSKPILKKNPYVGLLLEGCRLYLWRKNLQAPHTSRGVRLSNVWLNADPC